MAQPLGQAEPVPQPDVGHAPARRRARRAAEVADPADERTFEGACARCARPLPSSPAPPLTQCVRGTCSGDENLGKVLIHVHPVRRLLRHLVRSGAQASPYRNQLIDFYPLFSISTY